MESYCTPYDPFYTSTSLHLKEVTLICVVCLLKKTQQDLGKKLIFRKEYLCLLSSPNSWTPPTKTEDCFWLLQGKTWEQEYRARHVGKAPHILFYIYTMLSLSCRKPQHQSRGVGVMMPGPGPPGHASHIGPNLVTLLQLPLVSFVTLLRLHHCWVVGMYINVFHVGCIVFPLLRVCPARYQYLANPR